MARAITINDLEATSTGPVWVLNTSGPSTGGRGNIALLLKVNGEPLSIGVPVTWIPINLTEQVAKEHLVQSAEFRRALYRGQLRLIGEDEARTMLSESGATEEASRCSRFNLNGRPMAERAAPEEADQSAMLSAAVQGIIQMMLDKSQSDVEIINSIRSQGTLSLEELRALSKEAKTQGRSEVRAYCRSEMTRQSGNTQE